MLARVFIVVLLLLLNACTTTEYTQNRNVTKRAPFDGQVTVLQTLPSSDYEVLGTLIVTGRAYANEEDMLELLVEQAAEQGANAVALQGKPIEVQTTGGLETRLAGTLLWLE